MTKELGIGVRVYVKWTPPSRRLNTPVAVGTGTIIDGPMEPHMGIENGQWYSVEEPSWDITMDAGPQIWACEGIIEPIDDDDWSVITHHQHEEPEHV